MLLGFIVTVCWIPETIGKDGRALSLEEIGEMREVNGKGNGKECCKREVGR
jgi:hypothetical protein